MLFEITGNKERVYFVRANNISYVKFGEGIDRNLIQKLFFCPLVLHTHTIYNGVKYSYTLINYGWYGKRVFDIMELHHIPILFGFGFYEQFIIKLSKETMRQRNMMAYFTSKISMEQPIPKAALIVGNGTNIINVYLTSDLGHTFFTPEEKNHLEEKLMNAVKVRRS